MKRQVIFTDLDGTLLDHETYSFKEALPALDLIRKREIPLVICSSKTRGEIERYRLKLGNRHPFICENGGGIFIPIGYFAPFSLQDCKSMGEYSVIRLGADYKDLRRTVIELRNKGFAITGFGDMTVGQVSRLTGLSAEEAALAMKREFDEPFVMEWGRAMEAKLEEEIRARGFHLTKGRFFHILGDSDKGKAVTILAGLYRQIFGEIETVALGDSLNDLPMLECVDYPLIVKKPGNKYEPGIDVPRLIKADGIGPSGWNTAVMTLLEKM